MKIRIAFPVGLALAAMLQAQGTGGGFQGGAKMRSANPEKHDVVVHAEGVAPWTTFEFISAEMLNGKTVKGAPYSAEAVTETTQTLADGNRITRRSSSMLYRDSEGRERREESFRMLGRLQNEAEAERTVFISDPVAELSYVLYPGKKTADKSRIATYTLRTGGAGGAFGTVSVPPPGEMVAREIRVAAGGRGGGGRGGVTRSDVAGEREQAKKETLGKRIFDGVEAEGTRTTVTIPAGEIGNERPIEIVSERWYSTELQTLIMSRHSDPRTGETVYKLSGINRSEPVPSLFEIPADYTVNDRSRVLRVKPVAKDEI